MIIEQDLGRLIRILYTPVRGIHRTWMESVPWHPEMDENQHKIHGGFALEFRMKSSN